VQNVGPDVKFEQSGDPLPLTARGGAAWTLEVRPSGESHVFYTATRMTLTADAIQVRNETFAAAAGGEFSIDVGSATTVAVRVGNLFDSASDGGLSFGIGLREGRFTGDYALVSRGALGNVQNISLGVRF
jgi:hypothetical protein